MKEEIKFTITFSTEQLNKIIRKCEGDIFAQTDEQAISGVESLKNTLNIPDNEESNN